MTKKINLLNHKNILYVERSVFPCRLFKLISKHGTIDDLTLFLLLDTITIFVEL